MLRFNINSIKLLFLVCALCAGTVARAITHKERVKWFEDARMGIMIHWTLGNAAAGRYDGEKLRKTTQSEWGRYYNKIQKADWDKLALQMPITEEAIEEWVKATRDGGFKYLTMVAKHHDGVAFWNSEVDDYTYGNLSGTGFDVMKCLKEKCDKYGIVLCAYYSHWLDWGYPCRNNDWDYADEQNPDFDRVAAGRGEIDAPYKKYPTPEEFEKYWYGKAMPQVAELIKRYGVKLIWFDWWGTDPVTDGQMTRKEMEDMLAMIRELDPTVMVNSRLGIKEVGDNGVDYQTMPDNKFPAKPLGHCWETAATFNMAWGYNRDDQRWRPTTYFIREIVKAICKGGNTLLNIGPRGDGSIPAEILSRMAEIGKVVKTNKAGYYGNVPSPFSEDSQDWGLITQRTDNGKTTLYMHVFDWPNDGVIRVNGLKNKVVSARIPALGKKIPFAQNGYMLHLNGPMKQPVDYDTVIVVEIEGDPEVDNDYCGEINDGGVHMAAGKKAHSGEWRVYIPEAGEHEVRICYACDDASAGQDYQVRIDGNTVIDCRTVAGPQGFDEYYTRHLGKIRFDEPGFHTLSVTTSPRTDQRPMALKWLYME